MLGAFKYFSPTEANRMLTMVAKLRDCNFSQQRDHSEEKQKSLCYVEVGFHGTDLEGASAITRCRARLCKVYNIMLVRAVITT